MTTKSPPINTKIGSYLRYGVPQELSEKLCRLGIPLNTFRVTSKKNLIDRYELDSKTVDAVKPLIKREPIEEELLWRLLQVNNYTCCCCRGIKGDTYLIHHIVPYEKSQDNTYGNLAVLCPNCHDLAHQGAGLTSRISEYQLLKSKKDWERQIERSNVDNAALSFKIHDIDYVNIPRINELARRLQSQLPGIVIPGAILRISPTNRNQFHAGWTAKHEHSDVFRSLIPHLRFRNLDDFLSKRSVADPQFVGAYCYYVGGVYAKSPKIPISKSTGAVEVYVRKRGFYIRWIIDPLDLVSMTAVTRLGTHSVYSIYGRVRSVAQKPLQGRQWIEIDIRPYIMASPEVIPHRTPAIAFQKSLQLEDWFPVEDDAE
jgi:5-methylcytosine-specific restriction endonuclease McrA